MEIIFASVFFVSVPLSVQKPLLTSHGDERDRKGNAGKGETPLYEVYAVTCS